MKRIYFILMLFSLFLIEPTLAQDKSVSRPTDIGESEFDNFKNSAFNVMEESTKLKRDLTHVDDEIKSYGGVLSEVATDKLKGHYQALTGIRKETEAVNANISQLDDKGKEMVASASKVTPKMKSIKATANTKKSVEGLDVAKGNMKAIADMLQEDTKLLATELKSRGEPIE
jgi:methyl-accepting chemotaxis protein